MTAKIKMRRPKTVLVVWHPDFGRGRVTGLSKDGDAAMQVRFDKSTGGKYSRIISCQWLYPKEGGFFISPQVEELRFRLPTFDPRAKAEARQRWLNDALAGYKGRKAQIKAHIIVTSNGNRRNGVERACSECGTKFIAKREDKDTCSAACRKRKSRQGRGKTVVRRPPPVKGVQYQEWLLEHNS